MSDLRVDPSTLDQLAHTFRAVGSIGIPPIDTPPTGHRALDEAVARLRSVVGAASTESDRSTFDHARSIRSAAGAYRSVDGSLNHGPIRR